MDREMFRGFKFQLSIIHAAAAATNSDLNIYPKKRLRDEERHGQHWRKTSQKRTNSMNSLKPRGTGALLQILN